MKHYLKHSITNQFRYSDPGFDLQLCGDKLFILLKEIYYDGIN